MGDLAIIERIREFLTPLFETKACTLKFTYNGKTYTTKLTASHTADKIQLKNNCVNVSYDLVRNEWKGGILADSEERACFDPILMTNARNKVGKRTTAADVLQILKTKLCLACPVETPVMLIDQANTFTMMISPFHILRGSDAFYEKYGYSSDVIDDLKEGLRDFTWSDCSPEMKTVVQEFTKERSFSPETRLIDIMKGVSWDQESEFSGTRGSCWSADLLELYAMKTKGYTKEQLNQFSPLTIWTFTLQQDDSRWIAAKESMVFTDFQFVATAGSRTRRKRSMLRRSIKTRARKQRGGGLEDIVKYFDFLTAPYPDSEIADFHIPDELSVVIKSEPALDDSALELMGRAQIECLSDKVGEYGFTKEYIESYSSRSSPLHIIGNIVSIEHLLLCARIYFQALCDVISPPINKPELVRIVKMIKDRLDEGERIDPASIKTKLPYIPFYFIKLIFGKIFKLPRTAAEKKATYLEIYGIDISLFQIRDTITRVRFYDSLKEFEDTHRHVISVVLLENMTILVSLLERAIAEHTEHKFDSIYGDPTVQQLLISFLRMKIVEEKYMSIHLIEDDKITKRGWDLKRKEMWRTNEEYKKKYNKTSESISRLVSVLQFYIYTILSKRIYEINEATKITLS